MIDAWATSSEYEGEMVVQIRLRGALVKEVFECSSKDEIIVQEYPPRAEEDDFMFKVVWVDDAPTNKEGMRIVQ